MRSFPIDQIIEGLRPLKSGAPRWVDAIVAGTSFALLIFLSLGFLFSLFGVAVTLLAAGLILEKIFGLRVFPGPGFYA